jgi:DNA end-binding protein Ku
LGENGAACAGDLAAIRDVRRSSCHYEDALKELLKKKQSGEEIEAPKEHAPAKVINLMDVLRRSVEAERGGQRRKGDRHAAAHHRGPKKAGRSSRQKKAG